MSVQHRAASQAGWMQGPCCPWGDVVAPGSSPRGSSGGLLYLRLCWGLFPCCPIFHTLPRATAFPALRCHSSFPSCSKIPVKPLSRMWGVPPQPHTPRTTSLFPQNPHGMAQLHADGKPEGMPLAERHKAWTGLPWWHGQLTLALVRLLCGGFHIPAAAWGLSPA